MRLIHKYMIPLREIASVQVHGKGELLHIGMQKDVIYAWFVVEVDGGETEEWRFFILGTGSEVPDGLLHVGTVIDTSHGAGPGGNGYVWHLFMEG